MYEIIKTLWLYSQADIIIWDFEERRRCFNLKLHKVKVEAMAFSPNDKYLVSLGGQDDGRWVIACVTAYLLGGW